MNLHVTKPYLSIIKRRLDVVRKLLVFILCIGLLWMFVGCNSTREIEILNFKAKNVESVEIYKFNIPTQAQGMIVTENKDIEKIINVFSEIKIEGDARDFNVVGGEVTSFRFNLRNGEEFTVAYWEGILRNLDNINYKVSGNHIVDLWYDLDYQKNDVDEDRLPIVND